MADEDNAASYEPDSEQTNPEGEKDRVFESEAGATQQPNPKQTGNIADKPPKAAVTVRLWHGLWRKRIFFHKGGPNWAEISIVFLTIGILVVGAVQATIYWEQSQTMQRSLEQNQQTIALNMGQVAIAGRNAKTAEDTLNEMQNSVPNADMVANATKSAAETAAATLKTNQQQFRMEQRPLVWVTAGIPVPDNILQVGTNRNGNPMSITSLDDLKRQNLPLAFNVIAFNGGRSPARDYRNTEITVIFDDATAAVERVKDYKPEYAVKIGSVLMPLQTAYFHTTKPIVLTDDVMRDLKSGKKAIFITGRLEYRDIFSPVIPVYESQFCFLINPTGMPFADCGEFGQEWIK